MKITTFKLTGRGRQVKLMSLVTALMLMAVIGFLVARSSLTFKQVQGESVQPETLPANSIDLKYINLVPTFPFHLTNATAYANNTIRIDLWFFQLNGTLFNGSVDAFIVYGEANIYPGPGYQIKSPLTIPLLTTAGPPIVFQMDLAGNLSSTPIINWYLSDNFTYVNNTKTTWVVQGNSSNGAYFASYGVTPFQTDEDHSGTHYSEAQIWPEEPSSPQEHRLAVLIETDVGKDVLGFSANLRIDLGKPFLGDVWGDDIELKTTLTVDRIANSFRL